MSLQHFYLHDQVLADEGAPTFPLRLSPDDAKHARVLRLAPGEHIAVVDAAQDYFECEIAAFDDAVPVVRIAQRLDDEERPLVMLVQGLAKGDKMETVIRHATELGVSAFVPMSCERSIVRLDARKAAARTQRWRAIAKSAAMQSGQRACPEVGEPMALADGSGINSVDSLRNFRFPAPAARFCRVREHLNLDICCASGINSLRRGLRRASSLWEGFPIILLFYTFSPRFSGKIMSRLKRTWRKYPCNTVPPARHSGWRRQFWRWFCCCAPFCPMPTPLN